MKRLTTILLFLSIIVGCDSPSKLSNKFYITGVVSDSSLNGEPVILRVIGADSLERDAMIVDGKYTLQGEMPMATIYELKIGLGRGNVVMATTEESEVVVVTDSLGSRVVKGDATLSLIEKESRLKVMLQEVCDDVDSNNYDDLERYNKLILRSVTEQINKNLDNAFSMRCAYFLASNPNNSVEYIDSLYAAIPLAKNYPIIETYREKLMKQSTTAVGKMFVDFDGVDLDGAAVSLSDYVGKGDYVLIDFWASWCAPCLAEIPNIKEGYERYKDRGLKVVGINVNDKIEACRKSVEEEAMTWDIIHVELGLKTMSLYGITGIPVLILFAPDGTIVNRTMRGAQIGRVLEEAFNE